ncbi:MAG: hypothetical protein IJR41_04745 [Atopobiaceae bacterium]|nr:hypothetical protein [Atopobiaceae bacterium]
MMRLSAIMSALCAIIIGGIAIVWATQPVPQPAAYLAVSDKPYIEAAEVAQDEADEWQAEQVEEYYEPVYYGNSYWYESDDADAEAAAKEWIAFRESGGDYNSRNGQYIGRYQLNEMYLDGDYSPENQEAAAEAYIADRYGSWQAAQEHWREYGWY